MNRHDDLLDLVAMFRSFLKTIHQDWNKQGTTLNLTQCKALYYLSREGPQKLSSLAGLLGMTSAAVTGIADQLVQDGFVEKNRAENDRRVVHITITSEGLTFIDEMKNRQKEVIEGYFGILPEQDIRELKRIFGKLTDHTERK